MTDKFTIEIKPIPSGIFDGEECPDCEQGGIMIKRIPGEDHGVSFFNTGNFIFSNMLKSDKENSVDTDFIDNGDEPYFKRTHK